MNIEIANMVTEYLKNLSTVAARDLLMVTMMPMVCVVIEDLINEGKIKLC